MPEWINSRMADSQKQIVPYGCWPSPLSAARVTAGGLRLDQIQLDDEDVYWLEGRASEGGRNVIVKRSPSGEMRTGPVKPTSRRAGSPFGA